ncbi:Hypothetical_protein [Hexamita inflata]|uniref:Hypothetical_protein n=1 Tax=Hexamita inflata TaxID=28002 RepID=A0AA86NP76_9EUKA|nr:Hypothetical protein HINF_LOCUS11200 [Hexamita inflata]
MPAERACCTAYASENGKGKYGVLRADERCRRASFSHRGNVTRRSRCLHEVRAEQNKVMRVQLVDVNAYTWKQMRPRRVLKIKSSEKTSEFRFQDFQQASQYLYIHLSESIRVSLSRSRLGTSFTDIIIYQTVLASSFSNNSISNNSKIIVQFLSSRLPFIYDPVYLQIVISKFQSTGTEL